MISFLRNGLFVFCYAGSLLAIPADSVRFEIAKINIGDSGDVSKARSASAVRMGFKRVAVRMG